LGDEGQLVRLGQLERAGRGRWPVQGEAWRPRKVAGALANKKVVAFEAGELTHQFALRLLLRIGEP
jgi:hypothetical protein